MKLDKVDKLAIYVRALGAIIQRPGDWPKKLPPDKEGKMKDSNRSFAVACWAASFTRAAVYVLEREDQGGGDSNGAPGAGGQAEDTPF